MHDQCVFVQCADCYEDTIDGITVAASIAVTANASAQFIPHGPTKSDMWLFNFESANAEAYDYLKLFIPSIGMDHNGTAFADPTADVINTISQLMFRGATSEYLHARDIGFASADHTNVFSTSTVSC